MNNTLLETESAHINPKTDGESSLEAAISTTDGKRKLEDVISPEPAQRKHRQLLKCIAVDNIQEEIFVRSLFNDSDTPFPSHNDSEYDGGVLNFTQTEENTSHAKIDHSGIGINYSDISSVASADLETEISPEDEALLLEVEHSTNPRKSISASILETSLTTSINLDTEPLPKRSTKGNTTISSLDETLKFIKFYHKELVEKNLSSTPLPKTDAKFSTAEKLTQAQGHNEVNTAMASNPSPKPTPRTKLNNEDITLILQNERFHKKIQDCVAIAIAQVLADSITPMQNRIKKVEEKAESNSNEIASLNTKIDTSDHNTLKAEVDNLTERVNNAQFADMEKLVERIDFLEQQARANNLIISGVKETTGENLEKVMIDLVRSIGISLSPPDIVTIFRAGKVGPNNRPRIILVKLLNLRAKRDIYRARVKLKKEQTEEERQRKEPIVFINEDLTPARTQLYKLTRDVCFIREWPAWTENGIVCLRNTIAGPPKKILKKQDLENLIGNRIPTQT